jgi:membrane protease subunit HflK
MPWSDNTKGRGPTRGPWGQPPRGDGSGDGGRPEPPDLDELLRASRQRLKRAFPRAGRGGGGGEGPPRLSRQTLPLIGGGLIGLWLLSGFFQVGAAELGVVTTFGKFERITTPGLHWRLPSPIQGVQTVSVVRLRKNPIPESEAAPGAAGEGLMLTKDKNIVNVGMTVQWRIKGDQTVEQGRMPPVAQFVFLIDNPQRLVTAVGEAAIREVVGKNELDFIQTDGRPEVAEQTRALMQQALDAQDTGIEIVSVNLEKTEPPTPEVNAAFLDVIAAGQDREKSVNQAREYANQKIPEARGQAQRTLEAARAYAARVTAEARGQADRFNAVLAEYQKAPEVTRERMYLETVESVLGPMNKLIVEDKSTTGVVPYLSLDELRRRGKTGGAQQ